MVKIQRLAPCEDVANGRRAGLGGLPREGPESAPIASAIKAITTYYCRFGTYIASAQDVRACNRDITNRQRKQWINEDRSEVLEEGLAENATAGDGNSLPLSGHP